MRADHRDVLGYFEERASGLAGPAEGGNHLHSPTYRFNDRILPLGAAWMVAAARHALAAGEQPR